MRTTTVSQLLRDERKQRHISLEEMSKRTRIRRQYLEALEDGRFDELPPAVFVKGYITAYSKVLGLDAEPLVALLRRDFKESAKGTLVPREFINPVLRKKFGWQPITLIGIVVGVFFTVILGYVGFQWYQLQQPPEITIETPQPQQSVAATTVVQGTTDPEALVTINTVPVALQMDGSFETEVTFLTDGINTITVESTDARGKTAVEQFQVYVQF